MFKTAEEWRASRKPLSEFLQVGDHVDEWIANHFLCELPPAYWSGTVLQLGEASGLEEWGYTYLTLSRPSCYAAWEYRGACYLGQTDPDLPRPLRRS